VKRCISDKTPAKQVFVFSLFLTLRNTEGESIISMTKRYKNETWSMLLYIRMSEAASACSGVSADRRAIINVTQSNPMMRAFRGQGRVANILVRF
jgi:hypothetical protein